MSRILFLIPHPDDEIVAAGITAVREREAGNEIFGLYLTSGVPSAEMMWRWDRKRRAARVAQRRTEAVEAAKIMGITPVGFSDWPSRMLKSHLREAHQWISRTLEERDIDIVWVSAWEGGHQDHDVANFLASVTHGGRPVVEFAEYNYGGGQTQWQRFAVTNGTEAIMRLTPQEAMIKRQLLTVYRSEGPNLAGVRVDVESRRRLPVYDYSRPPHEGRLGRDAFRWVGRFLLHPRVDLEPSGNIYRALSAYRFEDGVPSGI
jgi:LmbE family N-acetylglucosaminyl deacetylase